MEQDSRVRPMSREENAAYRGVTVDESGAEPGRDEGQAWSAARCAISGSAGCARSDPS